MKVRIEETNVKVYDVEIDSQGLFPSDVLLSVEIALKKNPRKFWARANSKWQVKQYTITAMGKFISFEVHP